MTFQQKLDYLINVIENNKDYNYFCKKVNFKIEDYLSFLDKVIYNDLTFKFNEDWPIYSSGCSVQLTEYQKLDQYSKFIIYMFDYNDLILNDSLNELHKQKFILYNHCKKYIEIKKYYI